MWGEVTRMQAFTTRHKTRANYVVTNNFNTRPVCGRNTPEPVAR